MIATWAQLFWTKMKNCHNISINPLSTILGPTQARDLVAVLKVKLVIITQFFSPTDPPVGKYDNVPISELNGFGDAVWFTAVVDVAGYASRHRGVDHSIVVKAEHVDPSVLTLVSLLPQVCQLSP